MGEGLVGGGLVGGRFGGGRFGGGGFHIGFHILSSCPLFYFMARQPARNKSLESDGFPQTAVTTQALVRPHLLPLELQQVPHVYMVIHGISTSRLPPFFALHVLNSILLFV